MLPGVGLYRDDQNVALRLVSLTDRLYDAGIPVGTSGAKLDRICSDEMLAGGFRKKYLRAISRLPAPSREDISPRVTETAPSRSRVRRHRPAGRSWRLRP